MVYAFKDDPDGSYPEGGLLLMNSTLYGATAEGGYAATGPYFKFHRKVSDNSRLKPLGFRGAPLHSSPQVLF